MTLFLAIASLIGSGLLSWFVGRSITKDEPIKKAPNLDDGYFPPPWNPHEHPEKSEGWFAFQDAMRKEPKYYLSEFNDR